MCTRGVAAAVPHQCLGSLLCFNSTGVEGRLYKHSSALGLLLVSMVCPAAREKGLGKAWCLPIQVTCWASTSVPPVQQSQRPGKACSFFSWQKIDG